MAEQQKWEYCRVTGTARVSNGVVELVVLETDGSLPVTPFSKLDEALMKLGADSWELAGVFSESTRQHFLFKRPKSGQ